MNNKNTMARNMTRAFTLLLLLLLCCSFPGCRSTTRTRIFLLTVDNDLQRLPDAGIKFKLRPLSLPNYLNRHEFIKRMGEDEIKILYSTLWAETAEHAVNSAFEQNLRLLLGEDNVLPYYGAANNDGLPVLQISVNCLEAVDDQFIADFRCSLKTPGKPVMEKRFVWKTDMKSNVPYIRYYKEAVAEMAKQTAAWLVEQHRIQK